jgi:MtN3 and saliva related transmembrane protein
MRELDACSAFTAFRQALPSRGSLSATRIESGHHAPLEALAMTFRGITVQPVELIGWVSSLILLSTIGRQVYVQWKSRATAGVSKWLFVGQLSASIGYSIYSYLLHNWVFLCSNIALLLTAIIGEMLYIHNRARAKGPAGPKPPPPGRKPVADAGKRPVRIRIRRRKRGYGLWLRRLWNA